MPVVIARALVVVATLAAGAATADEVRVFQLPEGSGPHDAAPAPDGRIWYSAQGSGALGIVEPATGAVRQVPLGEGSAPHGVIQGPDGAAWLTDGGLNAIVRVDPRTDEVKAWPLPEDTGYANLNTATFDRKGTLWFTGQAGIYGSVDQATGLHTRLEGSGRARPIWDHHDLRRPRLLRVARRLAHRRDRHRHGREAP